MATRNENLKRGYLGRANYSFAVERDAIPQAAAMGSAPFPSASNRLVTEKDPRIPYIGPKPPKYPAFQWVDTSTNPPTIRYRSGMESTEEGSVKVQFRPGDVAYYASGVQVGNSMIVQSIMTQTGATLGNNTLYGLIPSGLLADRPDAGTLDRWYYATDELILYRDTGSVWVRSAVANYEDLNNIPTDFNPENHHERHETGGTDPVNIWTTPPATASSTGTAGQIAYDADYFYLCIADSTWRRIAHATW
jgi:hypothetical protein